jgi:molybdopterin synthase sulfur carrier subunit
MQINFYADLRPLVGKKTIEVKPVGSMTAREALETVTITLPELAKKLWQSPGTVYEHIHVFIDGRQSVFLAQGLETLLDADSTLDVFPPVGGGSG